MTYTRILYFRQAAPPPAVKLASQRHRRRQIHGMVPRSAKQPGRPDEASQPLLDNDDDDVLFTVADSDSDDGFQVPARLPDPSTNKTSGRSVRFEEDVQVIVPALRSTMASREAGSYHLSLTISRTYAVLEFDLDSEDLEDGTYVPTVPDQEDQRMPLLVGLLDSTRVQRSQDGSMLLTSSDQSRDEVDEELEGIVAKGKHGGGMFDSIANMANSILGAGRCTLNLTWNVCLPDIQELSVN